MWYTSLLAAYSVILILRIVLSGSQSRRLLRARIVNTQRYFRKMGKFETTLIEICTFIILLLKIEYIIYIRRHQRLSYHVLKKFMSVWTSTFLKSNANIVRGSFHNCTSEIQLCRSLSHRTTITDDPSFVDNYNAFMWDGAPFRFRNIYLRTNWHHIYYGY